MAINIGGYTFNGPYNQSTHLENRSGVYAIVDVYRGNNYIIDIGESANVRERVENHKRKHCWRQNQRGVLACAVLYTPYQQKIGRMAIEQQLRNKYGPTCGER